MAKRRLLFTFSAEVVKEPIIYNLGQTFNLVTNINRADISEDQGWVVLEIEGEEDNIEQGLAWATGMGMRVDPAMEDIV